MSDRAGPRDPIEGVWTGRFRVDLGPIPLGWIYLLVNAGRSSQKRRGEAQA
jgi:hypothetical protein